MRDGVFESSPTCLVGSAGSEGFIIFGVFFGPLVPCAYDLSLRASSGESLLGFSLVGPLVMLGVVGVIFSFPCSLPCYVTIPLGMI